MECHTRNAASLRKYYVLSLLLPFLHSLHWCPSADIPSPQAYSTTSNYFPFFCDHLSLHLSCFGIRTKLFVIAYDIKSTLSIIIKYFAECVMVYVVLL